MVHAALTNIAENILRIGQNFLFHHLKKCYGLFESGKECRWISGTISDESAMDDQHKTDFTACLETQGGRKLPEKMLYVYSVKTIFFPEFA